MGASSINGITDFNSDRLAALFVGKPQTMTENSSYYTVQVTDQSFVADGGTGAFGTQTGINYVGNLYSDSARTLPNMRNMQMLRTIYGPLSVSSAIGVFASLTLAANWTGTIPNYSAFRNSMTAATGSSGTMTNYGAYYAPSVPATNVITLAARMFRCDGAGGANTTNACYSTTERTGATNNAAYHIDSNSATCGAGLVAGTAFDTCLYRAAANVWTFNAGTSLRVPGYGCVGCDGVAPANPNAGVFTTDAIVMPRSNPNTVNPSATWYSRWNAYEYTALPPAANTYVYFVKEVGITLNSSSAASSDVRFDADFYTWTQTVNGGNFVRGKKVALNYGGTNNFTSGQTDAFCAFHSEIRTVGTGSIPSAPASNYWGVARIADGSIGNQHNFFSGAPIYTGTNGRVTNHIGFFAQSSTNARTTNSFGFLSQAQLSGAYHVSSNTASCGSGFTAGTAVDTCLYRGRAGAWTGPAGTDIYTDSGYICAGTGCSSVTSTNTGVYDAGVRVMSSVSCTGATCSLTNGALSVTVTGTTSATVSASITGGGSCGGSVSVLGSWSNMRVTLITGTGPGCSVPGDDVFQVVRGTACGSSGVPVCNISPADDVSPPLTWNGPSGSGTTRIARTPSYGSTLSVSTTYYYDIRCGCTTD